MKKVPIFACLALCATTANAKYAVTNVPVGRLSVVTKVDDISDTPIMHAPLVSKEVRLEWQSIDRRVLFFIRDNGETLTSGLEMKKPIGEEIICGKYGGQLYNYSALATHSEQWLILKDALIGSLISACGALTNASEIKGYGREFAGANPDFTPALVIMKAAAEQQFGGWRRRCIWFARSKQPGEAQCQRYSDQVR